MPGPWSNSNGGSSGPNESSVAVAMKIIIVGNSSVGKTSVLSRFLGRHHGPAGHAASAAFRIFSHLSKSSTTTASFALKASKDG